MAEKLARTRAKRGGNRSVMTKLSTEANELLQVEVDQPANNSWSLLLLH